VSFDEIDTQLASQLTIAGLLGFVTDPLVEIIWNGTHFTRSDEDPAFRSTVLYSAVDSVAVAARVYGGTILANLFLGPRFASFFPDSDVEAVARTIALIIWVGMTLSSLKRALFFQTTSSLGRVVLSDRLLDFVIAIVCSFLVVQKLNVEMSMEFMSIFTAGGLGAVAFGIGTKEIFDHLIGGLAINAWDALEEGDHIRLGDGTEGKVRRIGLLETEIEGYDCLVTKIPNGQVWRQRIINLSRVPDSVVRQELRFKYSDLDKLPGVLRDIKEEVRESCPKLVDDGSLCCVLSKYQADHIQAIVSGQFRINRASDEYLPNQQEFVLAIARAAAKSNVEFALPVISYRTDVGTSNQPVP